MNSQVEYLKAIDKIKDGTIDDLNDLVLSLFKARESDFNETKDLVTNYEDQITRLQTELDFLRSQSKEVRLVKCRCSICVFSNLCEFRQDKPTIGSNGKEIKCPRFKEEF